MEKFYKKDKSILNKYIKEYARLSVDIKLIDKYDYYIIYFLDQNFINSNIDIIDNIYNRLNSKLLCKLSKDIYYSNFYDFYVDNKDLENDINIGFCNDLTHLFF